MNKDFYRINIHDKILILFIVLVSFFGIFLINKYSRVIRKTLIIKCGNSSQKISLAEDRILDFPLKNGKLKIEIKNKKVRVIESPCPRKICVDTGWIKNANHPIVCIPNRVLIVIEGTGPRDYDVLTY